jgi:hypothetical protein
MGPKWMGILTHASKTTALSKDFILENPLINHYVCFVHKTVSTQDIFLLCGLSINHMREL